MQQRRPLRRLAILAIVLALVGHLLIQFQGTTTHFPVVDEVGHLPAGVSHWQYERFDLYRVNPPLVRLVGGFVGWIEGTDYYWDLYSTKAGKRTEFNIGLKKLRQTGLQFHCDFIGPRLACLLFTIIGVAALFSWLWHVAGRLPAVLGCMLWCFSPSILAHGQTICPDVGGVAMGILACLAAWHYLHMSCSITALIAGAALGLAMLAKLTWLTGLISLPLSLLLALSLFEHVRTLRALRLRFAHIGTALLAAVATLNTGYLFEGTGTRLGELQFSSQALGGAECAMHKVGNRFKGSSIASLPIPLPRNYLLGIDWLKMEVEQKYRSFLNGEWKFGSWPYYYVLTTLYKTPESTLLGAMIGLGVLITGIRRRMVKPEVISMFLFLIIPAAVCFASVSLQGGFNHHHRYVLMIYPPMFALAAYIASPVGIKLLRFRIPFFGTKKRSIAVPLAFTLVALSAASSLRVHPYYTSYFNMLSGGPENGWRLLGFSNIDWGQDILEVDKWLKANPDKRPLVMDLDYFGMNGNLFDIPTIDPPQLPKDASIDEVRQSITETQWWIISVKKLYNLPDHEGLEYLQQIEPVDKIAYAYHVYRIDPLP